MFAPAAGYLGTDLLRHDSTAGRYLLVDRWRSAADYDGFRRSADAEYTAFSEACRPLYRSERSMGRFDGV